MDIRARVFGLLTDGYNIRSCGARLLAGSDEQRAPMFLRLTPAAALPTSCFSLASSGIEPGSVLCTEGALTDQPLANWRCHSHHAQPPLVLLLG